ncbi:hypothetical protein KY328_05300 [Candidatus Woesearchaeota archaeon]|nr:hypothetical protein [Candidatus Woesearchaeota archaeon]
MVNYAKGTHKKVREGRYNGLAVALVEPISENSMRILDREAGALQLLGDDVPFCSSFVGWNDKGIMLRWVPGMDLNDFYDAYGSHSGRFNRNKFLYSTLLAEYCAAEALRVAKPKVICHGDVKPHNVRVHNCGSTITSATLGDWGQAVFRSDSCRKVLTYTPGFAAPEVLCGEVHENSDVHSLALFLPYAFNGSEMWFGSKTLDTAEEEPDPFDDSWIYDMKERAFETAVEVAAQYRHLGLADLLLEKTVRGLENDPDERLSIEEYSDMLQRALDILDGN